jgi:leucyl-tRNA synthetase
MVSVGEPFRRYFAHGMVLKDGAVMSKSRGGVGPDEIIARYGADALRTYVLFMGPPEAEVDWKEGGIEGISRFLSRVWRATVGRLEHFDADWRRHGTAPGPAAVALRRKLHQTIRRVTSDIERFHFNTAISAMMELVNVMTELGGQLEARDLRVTYSEACETLPKLLAPFAPHLAEEIWQRLGREESVHLSSWPSWDADAAREEEITIVVQVNGRLRDRLTAFPGTPEESLRADALASPRVRPYLEGKSIRQVVVVPDKLVNIVVG